MQRYYSSETESAKTETKDAGEQKETKTETEAKENKEEHPLKKELEEKKKEVIDLKVCFSHLALSYSIFHRVFD